MRSRMLRLVAGSLALASAAAMVASCGHSADASLCVAYARFASAYQPAMAADPTGVTAARATDAVEEVLAAVRQMRETTDGRYSDEVDTLEATLDDLRLTLESVDDAADYSTWAPLVEDSMHDVADAAVAVTALIDPECAPGS